MRCDWHGRTSLLNNWRQQGGRGSAADGGEARWACLPPAAVCSLELLPGAVPSPGDEHHPQHRIRYARPPQERWEVRRGNETVAQLVILKSQAGGTRRAGAVYAYLPG